MGGGLTVLIIGSGAREHALSLAYEGSPQVSRIVVAPGNDLISYNRAKEVRSEKRCDVEDLSSLEGIAEIHRPDLIDVADDNPIAQGAVDFLRSRGYIVFGPTKKVARLESDKVWAKQFMQRNSIPTPISLPYSSVDAAKRYVRGLYHRNKKARIYVKASGLCAGKGALKAESLPDAIAAINKMKSFGPAASTFLVEEAVVGEEFSYFVISDGRNFKVLGVAQDYKKSHDGNIGEQTGGMGAISPTIVTEGLEEKIQRDIVKKVIEGLGKEPEIYAEAGHKNIYTGILYVGGIRNGNPMVLEFNARWGDPEAQVIVPGITTDYLSLVKASLEYKLNTASLEQDGKARVCVVGASKGYPGKSEATGKRIFGLEEAMRLPGVKIFGSAVKVVDGRFYADGGRLFSVVGEGRDMLEARARAYGAMDRISIEGGSLHYRTDIGLSEAHRDVSGGVALN